MDEFEKQISWVEGLEGDEKIKAGSIVAWQGISGTLNELIARFNEVNLSTDEDSKKRYRENHLKKMIVGMLFELDNCLDNWGKILMDKNLLTEDIKEKKKGFKTEINKVGLKNLKQIRNGIAFHYTDFLSDPDALTDTYRKLDNINIEALNRIHKAGIDCGYAMRNSVI